MSENKAFRIEHGLRPGNRRAAATGYWGAFAGKLKHPLGPERRAVAFLSRVLDPFHAISAVDDSGALLGVAGFKTPHGSFIGGGFRDMTKIYGRWGAVPRTLLASFLERRCENDVLLMDGIFVMPEARGLGVGSALLLAIEDHARKMELQQVRLDVSDTNMRARSLYERRGFVASDETHMGMLRHIFGFSSVTTMVKVVGAPPD